MIIQPRLQVTHGGESPLKEYRAILVQETLNSHSAAQQNRTVATFHLSDGTIYLLKMQLAERSEEHSEGEFTLQFQTPCGFPGIR